MYSTIWRMFLVVVFVLTGSSLGFSSVELAHSGTESSFSHNSNNSNGPIAKPELSNDVDQQNTDSYRGECLDDWQIYEPGRSCYRNFEKKVTYRDAQEQCISVGGFLATVTTEAEMQFIVTKPWDQSTVGNEHFSWWMGYFYTQKNNTAQWEVAEEQFLEKDLGHVEELFQHSPIYGPLASDKDQQLCGQLVFDVDTARSDNTYHWYVQRCDAKSAFMCKRVVSICKDHKGNRVMEGARFTPEGRDICVNCTCYRGEATMCSSAMCAPPNCQHSIQNPDKCCSYTCIDDEYPQELFDFSDSMRWVLTSATSFLILGLLLFMVHRLRQRRMALIHYTSRSGFRQRAGGLRLNTGSGVSPSSRLDDIDAGIYREPPPPYSLYKPPSPGEEPPPPYDTALLLDNNSAPTTPVSTTDQNAALLDTASSIHEQIPTPTLSTGEPTPGSDQQDVCDRQSDESTEERENIPMLSCDQQRANDSSDRTPMA